MRSLYLRIYLTVLVALGLFALVSGWLVQRHFEQERQRFVASAQERAAAWGELLQRSLPGADAPPAEQAAALADWSGRLSLPLALDDPRGVRIAASDTYLRRESAQAPGPRRALPVRLEDGRTLWIMRGPPRAAGPGRPGMDGAMHMGPGMAPAARLEPAVAANPFLAFSARLERSGTMVLRWVDDRGVEAEERVAIRVV